MAAAWELEAALELRVKPAELIAAEVAGDDAMALGRRSGGSKAIRTRRWDRVRLITCNAEGTYGGQEWEAVGGDSATL